MFQLLFNQQSKVPCIHCLRIYYIESHTVVYCVVVTDASCNFESGVCRWSNSADNVLFWRRNRGATLSANTGPGGDHTLGNQTGHYVYVEMSDTGATFLVGEQGRFYSPIMRATDNNKIVTFWYNMLGKGVGCFDAEVHCFKDVHCDAVSIKRVWRTCGDQGIEWIQASANIGVCGSLDRFRVSLRDLCECLNS